jgi:hypothetical protein
MSQDEDDSDSSCDMETDIGAKEDILADIAPVGGWCSPAMRELQSDDEEIARVRTWVENGMRPPAIDLEAEGQGVRNMIVLWDELAVCNGVLVREEKNVKAVVLPRKIRADVFRHLHASPMVGGHMGRDLTYHCIKSRAWWPGCRRDVYDWTRKCHDCQLAKPGPGRGRMPLVQERAGAPFERVALDLVGPMPLSRRGKVYLLVMQDCFTKWIEVVAIPNKTARVVASAFAEVWVTRYGSSRLLHQDNESEFTAEVFVELCKLLGIMRTTTTILSPIKWTGREG